MKTTLTIAAATAVLAASLSAMSHRQSLVAVNGRHVAHVASSTASGQRTPILVELFTSEGCSDCPPADRVLMHLARKQPVEGADVVALGEHVDYWNNSRWRDAFSSPAFSRRQNEYADSFRLNSVYTPEMVVDGRWEFVGSDSNAAVDAIQSAASAPHARLSMDETGGNVSVRVEGLPAASGNPHLFVAFTEDGLTSRVRGGENAGATLLHWAVTRDLTDTGPVSTGDAARTLPVPTEWRGRHLNVVAFVQDVDDRRILGSAEIQDAG